VTVRKNVKCRPGADGKQRKEITMFSKSHYNRKVHGKTWNSTIYEPNFVQIPDNGCPFTVTADGVNETNIFLTFEEIRYVVSKSGRIRFNRMDYKGWGLSSPEMREEFNRQFINKARNIRLDEAVRRFNKHVPAHLRVVGVYAPGVTDRATPFCVRAKASPSVRSSAGQVQNRRNAHPLARSSTTDNGGGSGGDSDGGDSDGSSDDPDLLPAPIARAQYPHPLKLSQKRNKPKYHNKRVSRCCWPVSRNTYGTQLEGRWVA
jgi:hypothetical protein